LQYSDKTRSEIKKILNLANALIKDIICYEVRNYTYMEAKQRQKTAIEHAVSVYDEKLYFCKNAQTTPTCSVQVAN